ncbi:MAG TPA: hypothetical protein VGD40_22305 [Chryseosolibacter sp.]
MLRLLTLVFFVSIGSVAYSQQAASHEPTSATDGEVKLHNTKKSRFIRLSRARKSERVTEPAKDLRYRAEARETERHGRSFRKSRGAKKLNGEARVYRRHGATSVNASTRKAKARRALGRE